MTRNDTISAAYKIADHIKAIGAIFIPQHIAYEIGRSIVAGLPEKMSAEFEFHYSVRLGGCA